MNSGSESQASTAQTKNILEIFVHLGGPTEQFGTHEKFSWWGCKVGKNRHWGIYLSGKTIFLKEPSSGVFIGLS